jgi:pyrroline-5-carboxylate reductase
VKPLSIALLGGGNMGRALAAGLLKAKVLPASRVHVTDVRPEALKDLKRALKVSVGADNRAAAAEASVVVLCVKPQQMGEVLDGLAGVVGPKHLVVSIAAGIRSDFIEGKLPGTPVVRAMPNTPALYGAGAMAYCLGRHAGPAHEKTAKKILSAAGPVWKLDEASMDAVTALSGSGPAYAFLLAECMAAAGEKLGLPSDVAQGLARQTVYGAGLMLKESPETAATLRERVTSPGGTTAAALAVLKESGVQEIFERALSAACRRSRELSQR